MRVLVTGAAGFIGYHVARALAERGDEVVGIDNLNDYYDVKLKRARLKQLKPFKNFSFYKIDVANKKAVLPLARKNFTHIVHLAAQAGVRHSLIDPYAFIESNVMGQIVMLELARKLPHFRHFVYASSSSVYGGTEKVPFALEDPVDRPVSLYAATKRADELMTWTYAHLYRLPCTGVRFFTVYGPWGRPDMATYVFTEKIAAGRPLDAFNHGKMRRDFTYIDDAVAGILALLDKPPAGGVPVKLYNLGNAHAENLMDFIKVIEKALGKKAHINLKPMQPGDVPITFADISASARDFGYRPKTSMQEGVPKFVEWYRRYHKV